MDELQTLIDKWDLILSTFKEEHEIIDVSFKTWIKPLKIYKLDGPTITGPIISRIFIAPPINQKERPLCLIQNGPLFLALAKNTFFIKWFNIIYDC